MYAQGSHDPLDDAIDGAARSMTAVTPPASLRAAVRARLEQPRAPALSLRWRWSVAAAAVVLFLAVAMGEWLATRRDADVPQGSPSHAGMPRTSPVAGPPDMAATEITAPSRTLALGSTTGRGRLTVADRSPSVRTSPMPRSPLAAVVEADGSGVPPTGLRDGAEDVIVLEALTFEPMAQETVEIDLIETPMPLRAEWVEIEPQSFE